MSNIIQNAEVFEINDIIIIKDFLITALKGVQEIKNNINEILKTIEFSSFIKCVLCKYKHTSNSSISDPECAIFTTSECVLSNTLIPENKSLNVLYSNQSSGFNG